MAKTVIAIKSWAESAKMLAYGNRKQRRNMVDFSIEAAGAGVSVEHMELSHEDEIFQYGMIPM